MPAESPLRHRLGAGDGLIETFGWFPNRGAVRVARHRARMEHSAEALGIAFSPEAFDAALAGVATGSEPLRVRVTLDGGGRLDATAAPFRPLADGAVWRVAIAATRLDSRDPLLAHKTTRRTAYDAARAEIPPGDADEVLLLNERGEICEGTITSVFADMGDGTLATPRLACGLLAGILREELLESGRAVERVLTPGDLASAKTLFVGNSLRGLIAVRLVDR